MDKKNTTIGILLLITAFGALYWGQLHSQQPATPAQVRQAVAHLNRHKAMTLVPAAPLAPRFPAEDLYGVIPTDTRKPFDVREIIARIVDGVTEQHRS